MAPAMGNVRSHNADEGKLKRGAAGEMPTDKSPKTLPRFGPRSVRNRLWAGDNYFKTAVSSPPRRPRHGFAPELKRRARKYRLTTKPIQLVSAPYPF